MAKIRLGYQVSKNAKLPKSAFKAVPITNKLTQAKAAVSYIMNKIQTDDATLYASMDQTIAESTAELAQLTEKVKELFGIASGKTDTFFTSFNTTIPFILYNGRIITFNRTNAAEEKPFATAFANAMALYMASTLSNKMISNVTEPKLQSKAKRVVSTNLSAVDTQIASIVSTY
tara:strand:- start:3057 stop:3578 length:522 start_codon:yes stop_codon:yes gene_type:complete